MTTNSFRVPRASIAALSLVFLAAAPAAAQRSKMTAAAADLTPALEYLAARGVRNLDGMRGIYDRVEAMYRPMSAEVAAQLIPFGFSNVHVPFALRGDPVPAAKRRPGLQVAAAYIDLGEREMTRLQRAATVAHELAHAEFFYFKYRPKDRAGDPRLTRQHALMYELRDELLRARGLSPADGLAYLNAKWDFPLYQANEMAAYYIEAVVRETADRVRAVFLKNRYDVHDITSRADREALRGAGGRETLVVKRADPLMRRIYETPIWTVGGGAGTAYYKGEPIAEGVPDALKKRLFRDVLGLRLPETGDDLVALARGLDSEWARTQHAAIAAARDEKVADLEAAAASAAAPSFDDLVAAPAPAAAPADLTDEERAILTRVLEGPGEPEPSALCLHGYGSADPQLD